MTDIAKRDDGGAHQGAHAIYRALLTINDTDTAAFWPAMPVETRPGAVAVLDRVIEKLLTLSMQEQLGVIRAHKKETES